MLIKHPPRGSSTQQRRHYLIYLLPRISRTKGMALTRYTVAKVTLGCRTDRGGVRCHLNQLSYTTDVSGGLTVCVLHHCGPWLSSGVAPVTSVCSMDTIVRGCPRTNSAHIRGRAHDHRRLQRRLHQARGLHSILDTPGWPFHMD